MTEAGAPRGDQQGAVRLAGPDDVGPAAALRRTWRLECDVATEPGFDERFGTWIQAEGDRRTMWLGWVGGLAVGMTNLFEYRAMPVPGRPPRCWGYVGNMFVLAGHRDRGLGRLLLAAVTTAADERGYARLVLAPSPRSIAFYRRAGFEDAGPAAEDDRLLVRRAR